MQPAVSVIVPVLDDAEALHACLDALHAQQAAFPFEVIVVDNGSRDATPEVASAHPLRPVVLSERRRGSYAARNAGVSAARGPLLAFTDADCVPDDDWLQRGVAELEASPAAGGRIRMSISANPGAWEQWDAAHYLDQEDYVRNGFAATANLFVHADVFDAVGSFDASLLSSGDLEWGRRATSAGVRLSYAGDAVVSHRARTTARQTWRLHRRLGAGWRALAARGEQPRAWRDPFMRPHFDYVLAAARERGLPVRRHQLFGAHLVVLAARWTGRATGR